MTGDIQRDWRHLQTPSVSPETENVHTLGVFKETEGICQCPKSHFRLGVFVNTLSLTLNWGILADDPQSHPTLGGIHRDLECSLETGGIQRDSGVFTNTKGHSQTPTVSS